MRNGLRYASRKYWAKIADEMRDIYTAPTVEAAEARFGEFAENWRGLYPAMIQSWRMPGTSSCRFWSSPSSSERSSTPQTPWSR
jgi:transposase-like protein